MLAAARRQASVDLDAPLGYRLPWPNCRGDAVVKLPVLRSVIRRRLLVNYRVDPAAIRRVLPAPFRPQLVGGSAIAGVCLIHLEHVRPAFLGGLALGLESQNAAHRIAVEWDDADGSARSGVFIVRRDTASAMVHLAGGRLFPGPHHRARFDVEERLDALHLTMSSDDETTIALRGADADALPADSAFPSLGAASAFFEAGSVGYSPARTPGRIEGFCLEAVGWKVVPFHLEFVRASFFEDGMTFPEGTVRFDHALIMRDVESRWRAVPDLPA
jgi:hypothetical protein